MAPTLEAISQFPKTLERHSKQANDGEIDKALADIGRVKNLNPPAYNEKTIGEFLKGRAIHLKQLVDEYFVKSMSHEFPLIDESLFNLKRHLTITKKGKIYTVVRDDTGQSREKVEENVGAKTKTIIVPLFAYTPLFRENHIAKLGGLSTSEPGHDQFNEPIIRKTTLTLEARLPGSIGPNLKDAYRHAMEHYFSTLAEMFTNPVAADIMYNEGEFAKPEIGAIWIPTAGSIQIKSSEKLVPLRRETASLDPAMVINAKGRRYLVKTWMVDNEEPFEHYIREFTSGDLKGRISSGKR